MYYQFYLLCTNKDYYYYYNVIVGCLYRPPWVDVGTFNVLLNNMLDSLHKNNHVFLLGDFNVDLSPDFETTAAVEELKKHILLTSSISFNK